MYERYLTSIQNGVRDVEIDFDDTEQYDDHTTAVEITVSFCVTTDTEAWMTVCGDGKIYVAFGGTGTTQAELDEYATQAIEIYRAITGDDDTDFIYSDGTPINE